jgi:hypothetical protein
MRDWAHIQRLIQDNITLLVFLAVAFLMATAWIIFEAMRSHSSRQEVFRLRRKLSALEAERSSHTLGFSDPIVLARRWLHSGGAATTSDGGCLLYIDKVFPDLRSVELTVRVDGDAVFQNHTVRAGGGLEASGKYGTYILRLYAVEGAQADLAIALRNRHKEAED